MTLAGLLAVASPAFAACHISKVDLPVTMRGPEAMLHTKVNGTDAVFIVDSGAFWSMMSPAGALQLKLSLVPTAPGFMVSGVGGSTAPSVATVKTFTLAGIPVRNVEFLVGGGDFGGGAAIGLLGQNVLRIADIEYDLANGMIRLVLPTGCGNANFAYWAKDGQPYGVMDISRSEAQAPHTQGWVTVNGVRMLAMFDTGAGTSVLSLAAARRAGIRPDGPDVHFIGETHGVGPRPVPVWSAPIKTFDLGSEQIQNTRIEIGELGEGREDLLIGADFFLSHHVYVSNAQRKLYFTYNGGKVFSLATYKDSAAAHAGGANDETQATLTDAEALARRGAGFAARRDWTHALADLDHAIALKPDTAAYLYQRALARWGAKDMDGAAKDLDAAVKLAPDDASMRLSRAGFTLRRDAAKRLARKAGDGDHDEEDEDEDDDPDDGGVGPGEAARVAVLADIDAADKAAPPSSDLRLPMAQIYLALDQFSPAVAQYTLWTVSHAEDARMGRALNGRCWARALAGVELDKALADCNAALRRQPKSPGFLDSRGLVHLRRAEFDRALSDYDAALQKNPKIAWSLYGRGVARVKMGKAAEGQADIAAATALAPRLPERAKALGVTP